MLPVWLLFQRVRAPDTAAVYNTPVDPSGLLSHNDTALRGLREQQQMACALRGSEVPTEGALLRLNFKIRVNKPYANPTLCPSDLEDKHVPLDITEVGLSLSPLHRLSVVSASLALLYV
jgi:hypothetical protein